MKKSWPICRQACCCALFIMTTGLAQTDGPHTLNVPFSSEGNCVIVPTSVNGSRPLKLLLDTGMRFDGVYLFHKDALTLIDTTGAVEVRVGGAGDGEAPTATMIETAHLAFGDVALDNQRVVVSHSEHAAQFSTDGVIGWSLFGHYIVEIDYDKEMILLHDTSEALPDSGWQIIPIEIRQQIPFLDVTVEVAAGEVVTMRVYIDLASREAIELLLHDAQKFTTPQGLEETLVGTGLSGDIYGSYGHVARVTIGNFELHQVKTAFVPAKTRSKQQGADGILANDLLRRFNLVFDYPHQRLYLRPNKAYALPFD